MRPWIVRFFASICYDAGWQGSVSDRADLRLFKSSGARFDDANRSGKDTPSVRAGSVSDRRARSIVTRNERSEWRARERSDRAAGSVVDPIWGYIVDCGGFEA